MLPRLSRLSLTSALLLTLVTAADGVEPYHRQKNVVYAESHGVGLVMDIFEPTGEKNGRGIVDVVSGAWHSDRGKLRDHEKARVFDILCTRGYMVYAIRPGSVTKFSAPEMVNNIEEGIRWVKNKAELYTIDASRLGLMGASAGGHLACLTAVTNGRSSGKPDASIAAVGVFFPATDFLDYGGVKVDPKREDRFGPILRRLAFPGGDLDGLADEEIAKRVEDICPARRVTENTPPFLLIHGSADFMVPLQQSRVMMAALEEQNVPAELIVKKGGGHPWPTLDEEVGVMADWFDRQLDASPQNIPPANEGTTGK